MVSLERWESTKTIFLSASSCFVSIWTHLSTCGVVRGRRVGDVGQRVEDRNEGVWGVWTQDQSNLDRWWLPTPPDLYGDVVVPIFLFFPSQVSDVHQRKLKTLQHTRAQGIRKLIQFSFIYKVPNHDKSQSHDAFHAEQVQTVLFIIKFTENKQVPATPTLNDQYCSLITQSAVQPKRWWKTNI